jgi:chaperone protein EcpD
MMLVPHAFILSLSALILTIVIWLPQAGAHVVVNGTRVIYLGQKKEVIVNIQNPDDIPSLVQAWIDSSDIQLGPDQNHVPFIITPPLFRVDPGKGQTLRLVYTKEPLPSDRESLFWLNILDIPPRASRKIDAPLNHLEFAFKHRLKLLFRPVDLPGAAANAPSAITWVLINRAEGKIALKATNDSAFHVNFNNVEILIGDLSYIADSEMVPPFSNRLFDIPKLKSMPQSGSTIQFTYINDYGGATTGTGIISKDNGTQSAPR